jgi:hypothetical protein
LELVALSPQYNSTFTPWFTQEKLEGGVVAQKPVKVVLAERIFSLTQSLTCAPFTPKISAGQHNPAPAV